MTKHKKDYCPICRKRTDVIDSETHMLCKRCSRITNKNTVKNTIKTMGGVFG